MQARNDPASFASTPTVDQRLMDRARDAAINARREEQQYVILFILSRKSRPLLRVFVELLFTIGV